MIVRSFVLVNGLDGKVLDANDNEAGTLMNPMCGLAQLGLRSTHPGVYGKPNIAQREFVLSY